LSYKTSIGAQWEWGLQTQCNSVYQRCNCGLEKDIRINLPPGTDDWNKEVHTLMKGEFVGGQSQYRSRNSGEAKL